MAKFEIRNRVRALRLGNELTQQELADSVGCSRQTIVLLEQERYSPSLSLALRIARLFNQRVDDVFELADEVM
jgi:putative transcriptional regulator